MFQPPKTLTGPNPASNPQPPTYRSYDDPAEQWQEWKRQAYTLPLAEVARHAKVSTQNGHRCRECFCCACIEAEDEMRHARGYPENWRTPSLPDPSRLMRVAG